MFSRAALLLLLLALSACKPAEDGHAQAIIGAVLIDGTGGPPLTDSVVVVAEGRVRDAGRQGEVPVSGETNKVNGGGRYVVPGFVEVVTPSDPALRFAAPGPASADDARARISAFTRKPAAIHVWPANIQPSALEALLEAARADDIAIMGHPASQSEAQFLVQNGASVLIGMIRDTDSLDAEFVTRLRDLRIVYAPELTRIPPAELERASRNTGRLFSSGVPLAVSSAGDFVAECQLLARAGVPPLDVVVAATANGARAMEQSADRGTLQPGKRADLLMLQANPGEETANLRKVDRRMVNGEWIR